MLEKRFDVNGNVNDMYVCASCHVVDNFSITPESGLEETSAQRDASVAYYTISDEQLEHIRGELSGTKGILDYFQSYFSDIDHKSFLEIGSGLGLMLLAADQFGFGEVVGVDLNTDSFAELKQYFPPSKDIQMHPDLEHVQVQADYVFMWHTLEHIYDPTAF